MFYDLALWNICANLHQNHFNSLKSIVFTSLVTYEMTEWTDRQTNGQTNGQQEDIMPLAASVARWKHKNRKLTVTH